MTRKLVNPIPFDVVAAQRNAADPQSSVWVEANAGSGKTYVLVRRVLRLLLAGVRPEQILCLTYTKAAAAEMRRRVGEVLSRWAILPDSELLAQLAEMTGEPSSPAQSRRARTLFAEALETPGGLKILTIHAFCESVLHRFPVEALVPFDFAVLEDFERETMIQRAREAVLAGGLAGSAETSAVETLFDLLSDSQISAAIDTALAESRKIRPLLADPAPAKAALRRLVGMGGEETRSAILAAIADGYTLAAADHAAILTLCPPGGGGAFEDRLALIDPERPEPALLLATFLTAGEQTVPKRGFPKKLLADAEPLLADRLRAEAERLEGLAQRLKRATLVERSEALLDVLAAIAARYEAEKRARSLLDFDDLVARLAGLLRDPAQGPWVQYKLDAGIAHILVDESQDTNAEQWNVVEALAAEFFAGKGAVEAPRTLFAVGDGKQSIYSFQGADPRLFGQSGRDFQARAQAVEMRFLRQPLHTSFRTLPNILAAVDAVFADLALQQAILSEEPVGHATARAEGGGMVTLWPPVQAPGEPPDPDNWPLQAPESLKSAPRQVAERIAREVRRWIDDRRPLGPRGRAVRPDDVLILVQSRSALFHEIIRALLREALPTPGADRLAITSHIAVLDLLALGDVLLNPADDLQLAALLRSPLFDISEDELFALAQKRPERARLWDALAESGIASAKAAYGRLHAWRGRLDFDRPYEFYAQMLYGEEGLRRFHGRLGQEVDDVFAEFLDLALAHEQSAQPSLQGFLSAIRVRDVTIKRELAEAGGGVRVMTVHGAKGLESPIVILADAATRPQGRQLSRPVTIRADPPLLIHGSSAKDHLPETEKLRDEDKRIQSEEYWRKLYVGMTRAEDELYVTGVLTPGREAEAQLTGSWYEAIANALRPESEIVDAGGAEQLIYPFARPAPEPSRADDADPIAAPQPLTVPPLPRPVLVPEVNPSHAFTDAEPDRVLDAARERILDAELARQAGTATHVLLEHLSRVPPARRADLAAKALAQSYPQLAAFHAAIAERALSILSNPQFAPLFGPNSRAEVPFLANALRNGVPVRLAGRIDRLVVEPERVLVVDFKSDAGASLDPAEVPLTYRTQLALYALIATQLFPTRRVEAAILWTTLQSLVELPREALAEAIGRFTMR